MDMQHICTLLHHEKSLLASTVKQKDGNDKKMRWKEGEVHANSEFVQKKKQFEQELRTNYSAFQEAAGLSKFEDFINEVLGDAASVMNLSKE
ncbi:hypothetical protein TNCV_3811721 [Trichonephila clavipes]|nr:hypothetical protein TNCV_3811721 [Trichonephila clavipes]